MSDGKLGALIAPNPYEHVCDQRYGWCCKACFWQEGYDTALKDKLVITPSPDLKWFSGAAAAPAALPYIPYIPATRWESFRRWLDAWYWVIREKLHLGRWEPK